MSTAPSNRRSNPEKPSRNDYGITRRVTAAALLAAGLIVGCGGWAAQARLSGAIIAQGKIVVRNQVKLIQHRDGGIVADILVANGDVVKAGDVLVRLDETQTKAELAIVSGQLAEFLGRRARLRAERDGAKVVSFEKDFESTSLASQIADGELRLFSENSAMQDGKREQLRLQVIQYEDQVRGLEAQQAANEIERSIIADDLKRLQPLADQKIIDITKTRSMERDLAKIDGLKGEIVSNIARVKGQISEAKLRIIELDQQAHTDAQRELRDVDARISELQERLVAAQDRLSRMALIAPIDGVVNEVSIHSINGVIAPGQTVMSIVPGNEDLAVEARLAPNDIDQVFPGQTAKLRFSAFNQRTTPQVDGAVDVVAAAATVEPSSGQAYYLSTIAISGDLHNLGDKQLVPGMPVEVFFTTQERSALSYLVKPFTDQMMRSFREE
ncbi:MAG TPA: HlyD family type I secretion periplasmic adaptor subunit [Rhizobium sp.]|nr:HlyD family type I secretion periplasmic adaptor subunit [Rhizobium sp.]